MPDEPATPFVTPSPMGMVSRPSRTSPDPDRFLMTAKRLAMRNYNDTRDASKYPELTMDSFYVVWYTKVLNHWRAVVESQQASRLSWSISYNGAKDECYIDVWKKLTKIKFSMKEETE